VQIPGPTNALRTAAHQEPAPEQRKVQKAATDFEALLIAQMLRSAHGEGAGSWSGDGDAAGSSLVDLSEQQFAQALAEHGGLGIGKMVLAGLKPDAHR
jgi:Rod binding domain-containing protein